MKRTALYLALTALFAGYSAAGHAADTKKVGGIEFKNHAKISDYEAQQVTDMVRMAEVKPYLDKFGQNGRKFGIEKKTENDVGVALPRTFIVGNDGKLQKIIGARARTTSSRC